MRIPNAKVLMAFCAAVLAATVVGTAADPGARARACVPGFEPVTEYVLEPSADLSICLLPGGPPRTFLAGGDEVWAELRIRVELLAGATEPPYLPLEWWNGGPAVLCPGYETSLARDEDGWVDILAGMRGGGHRGPDETGALALVLQACPAQTLYLPTEILFNSPDLDGNLEVDLLDVVVFAGDYNGPYDYRSDFNWDGAVDLLDLIVFAQASRGPCR